MNLAKSFFGMVEGFSAAMSRTVAGKHFGDPNLAKMFGDHQNSTAGVSVTPKKVIGLPAVKRGLQLLANAMMNKRCKVVKVSDTGDIPDKDHIANSIRRRVNRNMLFSDFIEVMQIWACLYGNAVASIEFKKGRYELFPFLPDRTELVLLDGFSLENDIGQPIDLVYRTTIKGQHVYRLPQNVIHIQGFGGNGYWGYSLLDICKETFGGDLAAREHGNRVFGQGAGIKGFVMLKNSLKNDEAVERLQDSIRSVSGGLSNVHQFAVLEEAADFKTFQQTNEETQLLGRLEFDNKDLANVIGIQAAKLGVREEQSYNSLEMSEMEHEKDDVQSWETKWSDEFSSKLLDEDEFLNETHRIIFEDQNNYVPMKQKGETATKLYHGGLASKNEGRRLVNLPPVDESENDWRIPANINPGESVDDIETETVSSKLVEKIGAVTKSNLTQIVRRLKTSAIKKLSKDTASFIDWVDWFEVNQGPKELHESSIPMCELIKSNLQELLSESIPADELEKKVTAAFESFETELPSQFSEKVLI